MVRRTSLLAAAITALLGSASSAPASSNTSRPGQDTVNVHWLGDKPSHNYGTTFGLPWERGQRYPNATEFSAAGNGGDQVPLQSWVTAYWPDGSIKWTAHAISDNDAADEYTLSVSDSGDGDGNSTTSKRSASSGENEPDTWSTAPDGIDVTESDDGIKVNTGKTTATFPKEGNIILSKLETSDGKIVGQNGRLVLHSQSASPDDVRDRGQAAVEYFNFESNIDNVTVSDDSSVRALVTVRGSHRLDSNEDGGSDSDHEPWLPFVLRFYLYADSEAIRLVHTVIYDGDAEQDFISGIGIRFQVPLEEEELYNRHVRIAGVDGGLLNEAVQGITGLRRDPGEEVRQAQVDGEELPDIGSWDERVSTRMHWIPTWNDFSLSQLSPDGFTLKKRTKAGQSWLKIPGATRAGGLAYLGGATTGGLAIGLRDFWKRYPTGLDVRNAATDEGEVTLWLYSPEAEPLDLRPYHDGLGQDTYEDQLDALEVTYEDWEGSLDTPYGIARTNEVFIFGFDATPSRDALSSLTSYVNDPPVLVAEPEYISETGAIGRYWAPPSDSPYEPTLDFLIDFYRGQVEQRRWYGFLDYGDVMHDYDEDRSTWRYDIGGYAWDNSELSPDLFLWLQFLRTGREDVYRFAEAMTRHTGEVDSYHLGPLRGLGTRHGVQHFSDSAKQVRISNAQYRKYFFYLSGGDERTGEILQETLDSAEAFVHLDPERKVRDDGFEPSPEEISIGLGTDFSALAASWLIEWERRGPRWEEASSKLESVLTGIANLTNGFVTGSGLYNPEDGTFKPPFGDPENEGHVSVSHLSALFGLPEVVSEITDHWGDGLPDGFEDAWLDYCYYYNAPQGEQSARYGSDFGSPNQVQPHSRLTAYAAYKLGNESLADRVWEDFARDEFGYTLDSPWTTERVDGSDVLNPVDEATWVTTNGFAQYGLAVIQNLALVGDSSEDSGEESN